jgi:hypothetical protein
MSGEPDDLTAFTRSLANVTPHPGQLNRDALLFAAGRAAGRRGPFWPATAAALALVSTVLGATLLVRPPTVVEIERIVRVPTPVPADAPAADLAGPRDDPSTPTPSAPSPALTEALRQRERILSDGAGEQPPAAWASQSTQPSSEIPDLSSLRLNASHSEGERYR